jgi:tRNA(fMet)-specific endonuclease VapC
VNGSVVDTNVIIKMIKEDSSAFRLLNGIKKKYVPMIVVGELYHGAYKSAKIKANMDAVKIALSHFKVLLVDNNVARSYALIKSDLQKKGTPIPDNDIWIAATAHSNKLSLATFDEHFNNVAQIEVGQIQNI